MKKRIPMKVRLLLLVTGFLLLISMGAILHMYHVERQQTVVHLKENEPKKIVFYRDDCSDCQSIFPFLYYRNIIKNDLVFVNLNQEKNRSYITEYQLKSVPTIVTKEAQYAGTNKSTLEKLLTTD